MNKKIFQILENWRQLGLSFVLGLVLTRSIYNHLDFWQLTTIKKMLYVVSLTALFGLVTYFLLFRYVFPLIKDLTWKKIAAWIIVSLAGATVLVTSLPIEIPIPGKERVLEITATGEKSVASDGSKIAIMEIRDINGNLLTWEELDLEGDWYEENGMLVSSASQPATLCYRFDTGQSAELQVLFNSTPDGGKVTVRMDGGEQKLDLYEKSSSKSLLFVPVAVNLVPAIGLYGIDILCFALILFIISVWFYAWYCRSPKSALIFLICLGALSILAIGFSRPATMYSYHETPNALVPKNVFLIPLSINLILACLIARKPDILHPLWIRIPMLIGLLGAFYMLTDWNVFMISPDSFSYARENATTRPPVYPSFIKISTAGTDFDYSVSKFDEHEPVMDVEEPLMRVSRWQKIFLFLSAVVACYALMSLMGAAYSPIVALFFFLLYDYGFFPLELQYILSETVAQAWLFLILAAFIAFLKKPHPVFIPLVGLCYALLYLTRGAGIFAGVIFFAMILWALFVDKKKYWLTIVLSVLLVAVLAGFPTIIRFFQSGSTVPVQYSTTRMPYALQVAEEEDIDRMPDNRSKTFLELALQEKAVQDQLIIDKYPVSEYMQYGNILVSNLIQVSQPIASEMADDPVEQEEIQMVVARHLLETHRQEYYQLAWKNFNICTDFFTRLQFSGIHMSFWVLLIIGILLCVYVRGLPGFAAGSLILTHQFHLLVVSLYGIPIMRYVYATEFLVLMGFFILMWGLFEKTSAKKTGNSLL